MQRSTTLRPWLILGIQGWVPSAVDGFVILRSANGMLALWDAAMQREVDLSHVSTGALTRVLSDQGTVVRRPSSTIVLDLDVDEPSKRRTLQASDIDDTASAGLDVAGGRLWQSHNRAFVRVDDDPHGLHEIELAHVGAPGAQRLMLGIGRRWPVATLSSAFLRHVIVQDAFGTPVLGIVTPDGF